MKRSYSLIAIQVVQGIALGCILLGGGILIRGTFPIIRSEAQYELYKRVQSLTEQPSPAPNGDSFGQIMHIPPVLGIEPVNTSSSIVIEDINVNAPIVWNVSVTDKNAYNNALKDGVAQASISSMPSTQNGNTYLFAHSTLNPLEIERYSAEFTLLHRLEIGARITVFSGDLRYDYVVEAKDIVKGFETSPLTRKPNYPMLTLQTCDPPGIPNNRLIITARLINAYPVNL